MQLRHVIAPLAAAAAVAGPIAGCGSSNPGSNAAQPGGASSPSGRSSQSGGSSQSKPSGSSAVNIKDFAFNPKTLTLKAGTTVTATNQDGTAHTFTADDGSSFDTGNIDPNSSATVAVTKAGTFKYHCSIHPFMHGTLVVK